MELISISFRFAFTEDEENSGSAILRERDLIERYDTFEIKKILILKKSKDAAKRRR